MSRARKRRRKAATRKRNLGEPVKLEIVVRSALWRNLPAVKAGKVYALRYTEAATYPSAMKTLDAIDQAFAPMLAG